MPSKRFDQLDEIAFRMSLRKTLTFFAAGGGRVFGRHSAVATLLAHSASASFFLSELCSSLSRWFRFGLTIGAGDLLAVRLPVFRTAGRSR